jgi:hypothetical protein
LVTLLYRMLTGGVDIPNLTAREELGSLRLTASPLPPSQHANRVADRAGGASSKILIALGQYEVSLERNLATLQLSEFFVDGVRQPTDETHYQTTMIRLSGVGSFGDFILMLRYLVFYFEDRRALVWDPSAQRQILRMLFLPSATAQGWTTQERAILETDSRMRNLQAALTREERSLSENTVRSQAGAGMRLKLRALEDLQGADRERLATYDDLTLDVDSTRQKARQAFLAAEQERESRFRALEQAKLAAIDARFPGRSESGKYILAHLISEAECLVCGTHSPLAAQAYSGRLDAQHCVVCDADLSTAEKVVGAATVADRRVGQAAGALEKAEVLLSGARSELERAESDYRSHVANIADLNAKIVERSNEIDLLVRSLPKSEVEIREQRDALSSLRGRVESLRSDLGALRADFQRFVEEMSLVVVESSTVIETAFEVYAQGFLSEETSITRASHRAYIGQGGEAISFPAYSLDMSGSDFADKVRRAGPEDVSESQREFIDLAFRMALMKAAGSGGAGTLVIDAPEASLDAVFAKRAAEILTRFGDAGTNNRLIITSNLIDGILIPTLVRKLSEQGERENRLVDLFEIAQPTAAIVQAKDEYDEARKRVLGET